jgi:hypothetical protein
MEAWRVDGTISLLKERPGQAKICNASLFKCNAVQFSKFALSLSKCKTKNAIYRDLL